MRSMHHLCALSLSGGLGHFLVCPCVLAWARAALQGLSVAVQSPCQLGNRHAHAFVQLVLSYHGTLSTIHTVVLGTHDLRRVKRGEIT